MNDFCPLNQSQRDITNPHDFVKVSIFFNVLLLLLNVMTFYEKSALFQVNILDS